MISKILIIKWIFTIPPNGRDFKIFFLLYHSFGRGFPFPMVFGVGQIRCGPPRPAPRPKPARAYGAPGRVPRGALVCHSQEKPQHKNPRQRSLRRDCSFASRYSVSAPSRAAGAAHSGRYRDLLPLVAKPDSWQTRWRAVKRYHDYAPVTPGSRKVAGESGGG